MKGEAAKSSPVVQYRVQAIQKLVVDVVEKYIGGFMSIEGRFDQAIWENFSGVENVERRPHVRGTRTPSLNFLLLPLTVENRLKLVNLLSHGNLTKTNMTHVIVSYANQVVFATYDNFCTGCIVFADSFDGELLNKLKAEGTIEEDRR